MDSREKVNSYTFTQDIFTLNIDEDQKRLSWKQITRAMLLRDSFIEEKNSKHYIMLYFLLLFFCENLIVF